MTSIECKLDHRVHPRIIGAKGKNIRKLMDDFKVDIRFPRGPEENPDIIYISGGEDDCYDCRDHLLNIEEEFVSLKRILNISLYSSVILQSSLML